MRRSPGAPVNICGIAQPRICSSNWWSSAPRVRRRGSEVSRGTDASAHHHDYGNLSELSRANKGNYYRSNPVRVQSDGRWSAFGCGWRHPGSGGLPHSSYCTKTSRFGQGLKPRLPRLMILGNLVPKTPSREVLGTRTEILARGQRSWHAGAVFGTRTQFWHADPVLGTRTQFWHADRDLGTRTEILARGQRSGHLTRAGTRFPRLTK